MQKGMTHFAHFLKSCAWLLFLLFLLGLATTGMMMTAQLRAPETVRYVSGNVIAYVTGALAVLAILYGLTRALERFKRFGLSLVIIWVLTTVVILFGMYTRQEVDFMYVCQAAECFADGDYQLLSGDYFNECSYQLGTVLMLECVARLVPQIPLERLMQGVNVLISMAGAWMLIVGGELAFRDKRVHSAALAMYLLCLPLAIYCIHVYGTLPMVMLCSAAILCFVLYIRRKQLRFGFMYVLLTALAYVIKPNSAIVLMALLICAVLHGMESGDWRLLGFAVMSVVLAVLLARLMILQYEWRGGVRVRENVSMLSRLVMGLQDGKRGAGWYNAYIEQFFDPAVSTENEKAIATADLLVRLDEMVADPARTAIFFVQKALSQWLEPTYGTLLYGEYCRQAGSFAGLAEAIFSEESMLRLVLESWMKAWQQTLYVLSAIGAGALMRRRSGAAELVLPVAVLGGGLYHMIFEAKSQYIYVYALYLVPVAAYGLCVLRDWVSHHSKAALDRREAYMGSRGSAKPNRGGSK